MQLLAGGFMCIMYVSKGLILPHSTLQPPASNILSCHREILAFQVLSLSPSLSRCTLFSVYTWHRFPTNYHFRSSGQTVRQWKYHYHGSCCPARAVKYRVKCERWHSVLPIQDGQTRSRHFAVLLWYPLPVFKPVLQEWSNIYHSPHARSRLSPVATHYDNHHHLIT